MEERIDPYRTVHKAVRHQLTTALQRLSSTDWTDPASARTTLDEVRAAVATQAEHARHEELLYHPLLEAKAPGTTAAIADEHRALALEIDAIGATVDRLAATDVVDEAEGFALYLALCRFVGAYLIHLDEEEARCKPLFWAHCSDEELAALEGQVQAMTTPEAMAVVLPHFLAALDRTELVGWLGAMRAASPPALFARVLARGEAEVDGVTWARVVAELERR